MALIDKASLLFVPSVVAQEKAFNILPSGNRAPDSTGSNSGYDQTRADFDFDRGSNAAATRIGSDGLIKKYRENLFTYSNDFSNVIWAGNATWTSGQEDKDGGSDAWLFEKVTATSSDNYNQSFTGVQTFSIYVKKEANKGIAIYNFYGSTNARSIYNIGTGSLVEQNANVIDSNLVSYNEDWWRFDMTANITSAGYWYLYATDGTSTLTTDSLILQNAQLESGMVSTDYLESASVTGKAGVLIDLPRIDYSSGAGALLLEPSRQQLVQYSEYTGAYLKSNVTATSNEATSPEGVNNATKIETTDTGQCHMRATFTAATGNYTGSVFIKKQDFDYIYMEMGGAYAWFNINTGAKGNGSEYGSDWTYVDHSIEDYGNGWYRCILIGNCLTAGGYAFRSIQPVAGNGSYNSNLSGGITYWYGAQVEAGSYVSSYIPNHGESGGVTRAADSCSITGVSDVIGQTEGTIYAEFEWEQKSGVYFLSDLSDGSGSNEIYIGVGNSSDNLIRFAITNGGVGQVSFNSSAISSGTHKVALAYKVNDVVAYLDGVQVGTDTSATIPATSQFKFERANGTLGFVGGIKQTTLFKERLSNAELAALTA